MPLRMSVFAFAMLFTGAPLESPLLLSFPLELLT
jgi:hypothetical protein